MALLSAIPSLPVWVVGAAVAFYRERLGFSAVYESNDYAIVGRDEVRISLWEANSPNVPGAEPHIAGTASCRIQVTGIEPLYEEMKTAGVVHPNGKLKEQPWGVTDFTVLDTAGNAIGFFESNQRDTGIQCETVL